MDERELRAMASRSEATRPRSTPAFGGFPSSVTDLVAAQAARTPAATAITWQGGDPWSYARLQARADDVARQLLAHGVTHGELVGVYLPRRPEMVAAVLGIMRAGAAYVALDPAFPEERLRYMAGHAGLRHVVAWHASAVPAALVDGARILELDGFEPPAAQGRSLPTITGKDLAYVLYTSGSTGQPKGVRILQRNLVNFLTSMRLVPGIAAHDVLCAVTTLSFDIAALELYLPLMVGARIVIASEEEQVDPAAFTRLLHLHGVTVLQTTPTLLRLLVASDRVHEARGLRLLIGGEAMPRELAEAMLPECRELWNLYGPTETTVWSTVHRVRHGHGPVPLGTPIANTSIHVLDEAGRPVPDGSRGEIWIGGAGVADGYLHDPGRTAERFRPDPFAGDGSRMYRTGDLGSLRDGVLYFHGRTDDQIKLRGYRIEPGDIEAAALATEYVRHAVTVVREIAEDDQRLVLYVVPASADGIHEGKLRDALRARLPTYMQPQHIEVLPALPRTPNGKIDRKALPPPRTLVAQTDTRSGAILSGLESAIATIWRDSLKVRRVEPDDDFFDLGGDSLLAVRVFEKMQALTGVNLPLATLLTAPTVAAQAAAFRAAGAREPGHGAEAPVGPAGQWAPLVPIQPHGTRPPLFLIHAVGGNVLNYAPLARGLGRDQPVFGIQALGLDGITAPLDSIPEMARRYLAEIRRVQPHGPYFLAGGSMGGMIAYEMAQQLVAEGDRVGLLALMDTPAPCIRRGNGPMRNLPARRLAARVWWKLQDVVDSYRMKRRMRQDDTPTHGLRVRSVERAHYRALATYRPARYPGDLVLFRAANQPSIFRGLQGLGWNGYVRGAIEVIEIPGDHDNLIEQPELTSKLSGVLQKRTTVSRPMV